MLFGVMRVRVISGCSAARYQKTGVWVPRKCFSTDRVFRNETLDATHLAEFHQVRPVLPGVSSWRACFRTVYSCPGSFWTLHMYS